MRASFVPLALGLLLLGTSFGCSVEQLVGALAVADGGVNDGGPNDDDGGVDDDDGGVEDEDGGTESDDDGGTRDGGRRDAGEGDGGGDDARASWRPQ
ncbi:MAG: hypothetical protein ACLPJH_09570 [Myxococcaceae bacterium]